jgi:4-amino-4-deoxy-L-arabinose transferase-like glycosyltransferase
MKYKLFFSGLISIKNLSITIIVLLAVVLRVIGIWHDYPFSFYPDEAHFVKRALSFGSFDFNPHWFHKPAFYMYLLFVDYGIFFIVGKIFGLWQAVSDFAVYYITNPGPFYLIGRLTTMIFGVATIVVVYFLGERYIKKNSGLVAALFLTLSYGHVVACQDIKADIPASFFAILSMYYLIKYLDDNQRVNLLIAAGIAGIGTSTKGYPIIMLFPLCVALVLTTFTSFHENKKRLSEFIKTFFFMMGSFWALRFVSSPYNFIDPLGRKATFQGLGVLWSKVARLFGVQPIASPDDFISQKVDILTGFFSYIKVLCASNGLGWFLCSIGLLGCLHIVFLKKRSLIVFVLYPLSFATISIFTYPGYAEARHQLPLYPFLALCAGVLITWIINYLSGIQQKIIICVFLALLFFPLQEILKRGFFVSKQDTRNLARIWIINNIPAKTKLIMDENGPYLLPTKDNIKRMLDTSLQADPHGQFTAHYDKYLHYQILAAERSVVYDIDEVRLPWWRSKFIQEGKHELVSDYDADMANPLKKVGVHPLLYYIENGYQYAVVHSDWYGPYFKTGSQQSINFPSFHQFYHELFERGELIKEFTPEDGNRPGPVVKIFKIS